MRPTNQLKEWEWIEAYYRHELAPSERLLVEQEMVQDADFRQTVEQLSMADNALRTLGLEQTVRRAIGQELVMGKPQKRWRIGQLASLLVGLLLLGTGYLTFSRVDLQNYRNDVALTQRYRDLGDDQPKTDLTPEQRTFYRDFFDAQAYMANGQPELSIANLEKLARADSLRPFFRQAIQWHLANAYLLSNQPTNAEATLKLLDQGGELIYPINRVDRWKFWCQIRWQKLLH